MKKLLLYVALFTPLMLISAEPGASKPAAPKRKPITPLERVKHTDRITQPAYIDRPIGKTHAQKAPKYKRPKSTPQPIKNKNQKS